MWRQRPQSLQFAEFVGTSVSLFRDFRTTRPWFLVFLRGFLVHGKRGRTRKGTSGLLPFPCSSVFSVDRIPALSTSVAAAPPHVIRGPTPDCSVHAAAPRERHPARPRHRP